MGKLTAKARKKIAPSKFALKVKGVEKYPVENKSHARDALSRASEQVAKGKLSPEQASKIKHKADAVLGKHDTNYHNKDGMGC
jgi:cytochrome c-type biogenesis protein CcmE